MHTSQNQPISSSSNESHSESLQSDSFSKYSSTSSSLLLLDNGTSADWKLVKKAHTKTTWLVNLASEIGIVSCNIMVLFYYSDCSLHMNSKRGYPSSFKYFICCLVAFHSGNGQGWSISDPRTLHVIIAGDQSFGLAWHPDHYVKLILFHTLPLRVQALTRPLCTNVQECTSRCRLDDH